MTISIQVDGLLTYILYVMQGAHGDARVRIGRRVRHVALDAAVAG